MMTDEDSALIQKILLADEQQLRNGNTSKPQNDDGGWQTVSYQKRNKKKSKENSSQQENYSSSAYSNSRSNGTSDVFGSIEQHSEDRRRRIVEAQERAAAAAGGGGGKAGEGSKRHSDDDGDSDAEGHGGEGAGSGEGEKKKLKVKKPKKPKVTVAEAAAKIDAGYLGAFLIDITASYETQPDIQLMRFADHFGRAFASVSSAQFPWLKIFKESTVAKLVDMPLTYISQDVYKTAVDWLGQHSIEALGSFVLWSLDSIFADFACHQGAAKGPKKAVQQSPSKSQVAIFVVLAMTIRRRPDVLINLLPIIMENPKYQGQDKLPVTLWVIAQASQGDLVVGLYMWIRVLLPMLSGKSSSNPQSRDLILQLVERTFSTPKAHSILVNGAVKKGERVVPPSALKLLMRVTFPVPSARVKATERFEAVYPSLKEVALAGSSGSKAMKQVVQQILNVAVEAAGEGVPDLSREASDIFIWCLTQNPDCYEQWDMFYLDNIEASVIVLRKLSDEWKEHSVKHPTLDPLRETLKSFRQKNEKALTKEGNVGHHASLKDADKYCKAILARLSKGHVCMKSMLILSAALAVCAAVMSQNESLDLQKLCAMLNLSTS